MGRLMMPQRLRELPECASDWSAQLQSHSTLYSSLVTHHGLFMFVALNEHWQRVGDMAARTVVVDTKER